MSEEIVSELQHFACRVVDVCAIYVNVCAIDVCAIYVNVCAIDKSELQHRASM